MQITYLFRNMGSSFIPHFNGRMGNYPLYKNQSLLVKGAHGEYPWYKVYDIKTYRCLHIPLLKVQVIHSVEGPSLFACVLEMSYFQGYDQIPYITALDNAFLKYRHPYHQGVLHLDHSAAGIGMWTRGGHLWTNGSRWSHCTYMLVDSSKIR